ncbi:GNAT family N-acetyltransferase [Flavobacterium sp.]|uniref:GNAT family N-acetyltransferase n=1 Tax=Flavobacterium sp. TaxID=239 RepID=UPI00333ED222
MIQFPSTTADFEAWDTFVEQYPQGSHLLYSDWLHSYRNYGFQAEIGVYQTAGGIQGGFGAVIAKVLGFRFYIIPYGPVGTAPEVIQACLDSAVKRAQAVGACMIQFTIPMGTKSCRPMYPFNENYIPHEFQMGNAFKYVYSCPGFNWVDLSGQKTIEGLIESFPSASFRRDVRSGMRKNEKLSYALTPEEVAQAYALCQENADENGYQIRSWSDIGPTILNLIGKERLKFLTTTSDGQLKGAGLFLKAGQYYTFVMGGTKKEKPPRHTGHYLQMKVIEMALQEGMDGYNISLGGSEGVKAFKGSFVTVPYYFHDGTYYRVLKPIRFKIFRYFDTWIKPYKGHIAKLLKRIKG